jgi:cyclic-di-GMP phosphodiesterase TipF (flagellum assembly factor)
VVSANSASRDRIQAVVGEISELGVLVNQLAVSVASHDDLLASDAAGAARAPSASADTLDTEPEADPQLSAEVEAPSAPKRALVAAAAPQPATLAAAARSQLQLLAAVKNAVEENRLDIYLQPMVTLPQRKVRSTRRRRGCATTRTRFRRRRLHRQRRSRRADRAHRPHGDAALCAGAAA